MENGSGIFGRIKNILERYIMVTIDVIQIFIMTHNRANLLGDSIRSIFNQTAGVKSITVLDNESTDDTEK